MRHPLIALLALSPAKSSNVEEKVVSILEQMEGGFKVNAQLLLDLHKTHKHILTSFQVEIQNTLGKTVRVDSNRDLSFLLFHDLALPVPKRTPIGNPCVSVDVLGRLLDSYPDHRPFLTTIVGFKKIQSISKFTKSVLKKLDSHGRIHPEFNHSGCPTGRIYSYIQNLHRDVRRVLIPDEEGNVFIEVDWSQQELRILAAFSQEPVFLDCFARNQDPHKKVISEMFHKPVSEVTDEERKKGKTINYALVYGQESPGLAWKLNIPLKKAQELIDQYFSSLPMIQKFKEESREKFLSTGYAETALGRKTKLDLIGPTKERELRRGFNHLIQGTGADILRITLVRLNQALISTQANLKFCAHDSIYLEAKEEDSGEVAKLARSIMEIDFMGVNLPVTMKIHHDFSMGEGNA